MSTDDISNDAVPTDLLTAVGLHSSRAGPYSFTLRRGDCLLVSGPSGAGKSQLLRMIADLDENDGEIALNGVPRSQMSAPAWRRQVVYQSAEPAWWENTVKAHFTSDSMDEAQILLARLSLSPQLLETEVSRLSTGERQRMALIRSLLVKPAVLLLDEPTGALDQSNTAAVEALLHERMQAGLALMLVTHSPEQAERFGNQRLLIERKVSS